MCSVWLQLQLIYYDIDANAKSAVFLFIMHYVFGTNYFMLIFGPGKRPP